TPVSLPLTDSQKNKVTTVIHLPRFIYADVSKGETVGRIEYILNDRIIAVSEITTTEECVKKPQEVDFFTSIFRFIKRLLS
ncbi:MAG: D-alanyl-D-alanine carboxypeptidase, partial [Oscillospiraceae bacterium]|nr:D-alanyl-D-alanine carboxypeptidase [Oscillospiraceae bacterium]